MSAAIFHRKSTSKLVRDLLFLASRFRIILLQKAREHSDELVTVACLAHEFLSQTITHLVSSVSQLGTSILRSDRRLTDGVGNTFEPFITCDVGESPLFFCAVHLDKILQSCSRKLTNTPLRGFLALPLTDEVATIGRGEFPEWF